MASLSACLPPCEVEIMPVSQVFEDQMNVFKAADTLTISFIKKFFEGEFSARNKNGRVLTKKSTTVHLLKKKKPFCLKTFFFKTHFLFENFILEISL